MYLRISPIETQALGHLALGPNHYDLTREQPFRISNYDGIDITLYAGSLEDCAAAYHALLSILKHGNGQGGVIEFEYWMKRTTAIRRDKMCAVEIKKIEEELRRKYGDNGIPR